MLKDAKDLYLATDEDREGEAISWHLHELLKPKVPVHRLVFHEITKEAIQEALAHPRQIDEDLVRAQETRRIIDRLYGYEVSPLLWRKVRPKLSAGRVQSVAVRLIVERERQRMAFVSATYWDLLGTFAKAGGQQFQARPSSFRSTAARSPPARILIRPPASSKTRRCCCSTKAARINWPSGWRKPPSASRRSKTSRTRPSPIRRLPPARLQQEANRKLGFTARRTMQVAQSLYENGHITYMRTDSTNLAKVAIEAARELVLSQYGGDFLPAEARLYQTKVKNAQEAHEAIRPAGHPFDFPSNCAAS